LPKNPRQRPPDTANKNTEELAKNENTVRLFPLSGLDNFLSPADYQKWQCDETYHGTGFHYDIKYVHHAFFP